MDREDVIEKVKDLTLIDNDEVTTICQNHIDDVQDNEICSNIYGHNFSFLVDYKYINTTPVYDTGTVSVTQDSTTVTGSGTTFTSDMVGRIFKVAGGSNYYEIDSFTSSTEIELSTNYIGSTASGSSYDIYAVYYSLPSDFQGMKWVKQIDSPKRILDIPELTMANIMPDEFDESGDINGYVLSGLDSSGYPQVRFTPIQTDRRRVYLCYEKSLPTINSTGATSSVPSKWHMLFVYKLAEVVFSMNDKDDKANLMAMKFDKKLKTFIREDKAKNSSRTLVYSDETLAPRTSRVHLPYSTFPRMF